MSSLFGIFSIATGALQNAQEGVDVTSNNIANANTPGYSRQVVVQTANSPIDEGSLQFGTGAQVEQVQSVRNDLLNLQVQQETQQQSALQGYLSPMNQIQTMMNDMQGGGLQSSLSSFFNNLSTLSTDPTSTPDRQQVILGAQNLATAFNSTSSNLTSMQNQLDTQVQQSVATVNQQLQQIATLNQQIASSVSTTNPIGNGSLVDSRTQLLNQLSQTIGITVNNVANGTVTVGTDNGTPLVVGTQSFALKIAPNASTGLSDIWVNGTDITSSIQNGSLAGIIKVRDTEIPGLQSNLDTLANSLATAVNQAQTNGYDLNGNQGQALFTVPATVAGTAANIAVAFTNPSLVAASGDGTPGSNSNALAMANLQNQSLVNGQTVSDFYSNTVTTLGNSIQQATGEQTAGAQVLTQLQQQQSSFSGVSLDQEAVNLLQYQQAYQSAAKVISIIDSITQTAIGLGITSAG